MEWMVYLVPGMCVSAVIGYLLGNAREEGAAGAFLGGLFGPVGWLFLLCIGDDRAKCPLCQGRLPKGQVTRCRHCGGDLKVPRAGKTGAGLDPLEQWEQREAMKPENLKPLVKRNPQLRPPPDRERW